MVFFDRRCLCAAPWHSGLRMHPCPAAAGPSRLAGRTPLDRCQARAVALAPPARWRLDPGRAAVTCWRPLLGGRAWARCAWAGHDARLYQEAEHVRPAPVLGLPAVLHAEEVDPVDGGLCPGGGDADKLALVGAGVGHSGGHQLPLGDHVVDLGVQVGEGLLDHAEELLGLLGALAAEGVVNPIGGQQLIHGVEVPAVDDLLVEPSRRLLVVLDWHGPLLVRVPGLPDNNRTDHSRGSLTGLPPLPVPWPLLAPESAWSPRSRWRTASCGSVG